MRKFIAFAGSVMMVALLAACTPASDGTDFVQQMPAGSSSGTQDTSSVTAANG